MVTRTEGIRKARIDQIAETLKQRNIDYGKTKYEDFVIASAYNLNVSIRTVKEYILIAMKLCNLKKVKDYIIENGNNS